MLQEAIGTAAANANETAAPAETLEQRVADLEEGLRALFVVVNTLMERTTPALRMGLEQRLAARTGLRTGG